MDLSAARVAPPSIVTKVLGALGLVLAILVGWAGAAGAHAGLMSTDPPSQAELAAAPTKIVLQFDEPVEASLGGIRLYDANEKRLDVGETAHVPGSDTELQATVEAQLGDGLYVVTWRALSADSHPVSGAFTFQVGSGAAAGDTSALVDRLQAAQGTSSGLGNLLSVLRFVGYVALALVIGAFGFVVLVWPAAGADGRLRWLAWVGWAVLAVSAALALALEGPYASGRPLGDAVDATLLRAVIDTRYGHALVLRLGGVLLAAGLLAALRCAGSLAWRVVAAVTVVVLAFSVAYAGHAGTGRWSGLGLAAGAAHVAAMAIWLGGLVYLAAIAVRPAGREAVARSVGAAAPATPPVTEPATEREIEGPNRRGRSRRPEADAPDVVERRFSSLALGCVVVVVVTGLVQAWRVLDGFGSVWDSDYGRRLLVKTVLVLLLLAVAAFVRRLVRHHTAERGRLRSLLVAELVVAAAILTVTAVLVGTPPPTAQASGGAFTTTLAQGGTLASISIEPARRGAANTMHVFISPPGGSLARVESATARLSMASRDLGPIPVSLTAEGVNHFAAYNLQLPYAGQWVLDLVVEQASNQVLFSTPFTVR